MIEDRGTFHLYFSREAEARAVADQLANDLIPAEVRPSGHWLVLVSVRSETMAEAEALRDRVERLAVENGGEFGGWEAPFGQ